MADPSEAGTPPAVVADGGNAGTTTTPADGGLMTGLTPDQKALFMAQEKKAEEGNRALGRVSDLEARLAAIQATQYAQQQQADPTAQMVRELQEEAQYDPKAKAQLAILAMTTQQAAETWLTNEMVKHGIPADKWDATAQQVRQSGYRTSVLSALQNARGSEVPDLVNQLKAKDERIAALQRALDAGTAGGGFKGNPAAATPAAVGGDAAPSVTLEEYLAMPKELRDKASIKR